MKPRLSSEYWKNPKACCLMLFRHFALLARSRAAFRAGSRSEARMAMIAMTIKSSIREKFRWIFLFLFMMFFSGSAGLLKICQGGFPDHQPVGNELEEE